MADRPQVLAPPRMSAVFDATTLTGALVWAGIFLIASLVVSWLIGRTLASLDDPDAAGSADRRIRLKFVLQLARIVVFLVFFVLWAHLVPQLRAFGTALLASASVISIVLGIAAQNTLGNLIAGISILLYRPFDVGDRVQVAAPTGLEVGTVDSISLSHTLVTTFDNRRITVPNGQIMNQTLVNLTAGDPRVMAQVAVGIDYGADISAARAILQRLADAHPDVESVVAIPVTSLAASSVTITARMWCADAGTAKGVEYDLYEQVVAAFGDAGISIPYPWSNVIVHRPDP